MEKQSRVDKIEPKSLRIGVIDFAGRIFARNSANRSLPLKLELEYYFPQLAAQYLFSFNALFKNFSTAIHRYESTVTREILRLQSTLRQERYASLPLLQKIVHIREQTENRIFSLQYSNMTNTTEAFPGERKIFQALRNHLHYHTTETVQNMHLNSHRIDTSLRVENNRKKKSTAAGRPTEREMRHLQAKPVRATHQAPILSAAEVLQKGPGQLAAPPSPFKERAVRRNHLIVMRPATQVLAHLPAYGGSVLPGAVISRIFYNFTNTNTVRGALTNPEHRSAVTSGPGRVHRTETTILHREKTGEHERETITEKIRELESAIREIPRDHGLQAAPVKSVSVARAQIDAIASEVMQKIENNYQTENYRRGLL